MRLFRVCGEEEISAIKNDNPLKLTFGGALFNYVKDITFFRNNYPCFNNLWKEYLSSKKSKSDFRAPILKTFADIPKEIPLFENGIGKKQAIFKFYNKNLESDVLPNEIDELLTERKCDYVFLLSVNVAGFFANPNYHNRFSGFGNASNQKIIAVDVPNEIAVSFKGQGDYTGEVRTEYALPMYLLKSDYVLDSYHRFSDTDAHFKRDFLKGL